MVWKPNRTSLGPHPQPDFSIACWSAAQNTAGCNHAGSRRYYKPYPVLDEGLTFSPSRRYVICMEGNHQASMMENRKQRQRDIARGRTFEQSANTSDRPVSERSSLAKNSCLAGFYPMIELKSENTVETVSETCGISSRIKMASRLKHIGNTCFYIGFVVETKYNLYDVFCFYNLKAVF